MILPAMGIVSEIIPTFAQRKIFGYKGIAFSSLAIAFIGYFVWAHHMFTSGMSGPARVIFSLLTFLVAIPSAIKVFNWLATLYKGSIDLKPALLFVLGFIFNFMIGGFTGLVNGALAANVHIHDTYFVVAHFHYVMFGGTGFAVFAAIHYWYPKIWGTMYNVTHAVRSFWVIIIGFTIMYFPMFIMGLQGLPRRYYDYLPEFHNWNIVSTIGSWILVIGMIYMTVNLIKGRKGEKARANPWGGLTLEWTIPSPPPHENFDDIPTVTEGPYEYHKN
jgi:cytochrome c oxidase subunit 1